MICLVAHHIEPILLFDWVVATSRLLVAGAACVGAYVAWRGLYAWRTEHIGKAEYEVARTWLRTIYALRDEIRFARRPLITSAELDAASKKLKQNADNANEKSENFMLYGTVYQTRWEPLRKLMSQLQLETLDAEVLWGEDFREAYKEIIGVANELSYAISDFIGHRRSEDEKLEHAELQKVKEILYDRWLSADGGENAFSTKVEEIIEICEKLATPYVKSRYGK